MAWRDVLAPEVERDLLRKAQAGDIAARDQLVVANQGYVWHVAARWTPLLVGHDIEDLVSIGNFGLLRAVQKFDVNRPVRFMTYAGWAIARDIYRHGFRTNSCVRPPERSDHRIKIMTWHSLDSMLDGGAAESDLIKAQTCSSLDEIDIEDYQARMDAAMITLDPRTRHCVSLRMNGAKFREIGDSLGITGERVRQIVNRGIVQLRIEMAVPKVIRKPRSRKRKSPSASRENSNRRVVPPVPGSPTRCA